MFSKKTILCSATAFAVVASLSLSVVTFADNAQIKSTPFEQTAINADLNSTVKPDHVTLTWSADPMTTQTITWRTNTKISAGEVKYKKAGDTAYVTSEVTKPVSFKTDANDTIKGTENLFSVTLKGLTPGTKYTYMVGNGNNWSEEASFTTEAKNTTNFKFLVFGDSQSGIAADPNYIPWHDNIQAAYKANPDAKFFVNMGDLVEIGHYYTHWNSWFNAAKGVINNIPDMVVQGNHETYLEGTNFTSSKPGYFTTQFNVFQNGPAGLKGQTYSYNYGNVHFIVLDSQEDEETTAAKGPDILKPQVDWLNKDLEANKNAKWKIVMFHKTPYYNKSARSNTAVKNAFTPLFDKYHVDLVLNGHDHGVSRTYPMYNDEPVSDSSKGTVYYVTGRSGNKFYNDLTQKFWDAFFYNPQQQPCYEAVSVNGGKLDIKALKEDGSVIDDYIINKDNTSNSTLTTAPEKFQKTQLVVFGNMVQIGGNPAASIENNKPYVNTKALSLYMGIKYNDSDKTVDVNGASMPIPEDYLSKDKNSVSVDGLQTIGAMLKLNVKYDDKLNVVYVDNN